MDSPILNGVGTQPSLKVSILARLIPALSYTIPAIGGALSSFFLLRAFWGLKQNETAGVGVVLSVMAESTIPVLGSLYLGVICGIAVITVLVVRMIVQTKTASPSSWFFVLSGILFLVPAGLFAEAESLIIEVFLTPRGSTGVGGIASDINLLLISSIVAAPIVFIILTVISVLPLSSRAKPKWGSLLTAIAIEILLIAVTTAFQLRILWLYQNLK